MCSFLCVAVVDSCCCGFYSHYGRSKICRVPNALPSAENRALGKATLCRVLHSAKSGFAVCRRVPGARQSTLLGKGTLCRAQHSAKSAPGKMPVSCPPTPPTPLPSLKKMFTERLTWHSAKRPFAECCGLALGKGPLYRVSGMALGKVFLFFLILISNFFCRPYLLFTSTC